MINQTSINTIKNQTLSPDHVQPNYSGYCYSNIPGTILHNFAIDTPHTLPADTIPNRNYQQIIFILIDAFGWNLLEQLLDTHPLIQLINKQGIISQLTSQFPSTTTAHVTTIQTNQAVGEHGMVEWHYYEPKADAIITPLMFSYAGDSDRNTLKSTRLKPADIYPSSNIYQTLSQHNIDSFAYSYHEFADSPYNQIITHGVNKTITFADFPKALDQLAQIASKQTNPAYHYFYWGNLDAVSHNHSPTSAATLQEITSILDHIYQQVVQKVTNHSTLLLIGADHGQDPIDPSQTIYLNQLISGIEKNFLTNQAGKPLVPAGSCKAFFLHIKDQLIEETIHLLTNKLEGKAQIKPTQDLIDQGYFGPTISDPFTSRVGNLVIVPNSGESAWWYEKGRFEQNSSGHHGGLTTNEMLIPFLALPL